MRGYGPLFRLAACVLVLTLALALTLGGCSWTTPDPNYVSKGEDYQNRVPRKIGRGLTNVLTAPLEVPNQMVDMASEGDSTMEYAAGYVGGLFVGVGYAFGRVLSGGLDLVTAPISYPTVNGMDPESLHSDFFDSVLDHKGRFAHPKPAATLAAGPAQPEAAPMTETPASAPAAPTAQPTAQTATPSPAPAPAMAPSTPVQAAPPPAVKAAPKISDKTLDDL